MAYEISEITTLTACFFTRGELNRVKSGAVNDITVLENFLKKCQTLAKDKQRIQIVSGRAEFIQAMDPDENPKALSDMAVGVSGALTIKDWLGSHHGEGSDPKIKIGYLTGSKWPPDVQKFQVEHAGMKDYNSSDLIVYTGRGTGSKGGKFDYYYGVSLKKKDTEWASDPTLINKVFNSILQGTQYQQLWDDVQRNRMNFYVKVLKNAAKAGKPLAGSTLHGSNEDLWKMNFKEPKKVTGSRVTYENRKLINLKGSGKINTKKDPRIKTASNHDPQAVQPATLFDPKATQTQWHMRKFVNLATAKGYFDELEVILDENAQLFANGLLNLVLKQDLTKILQKNKLLVYDYWFGFALVTAAGSVTKSGKVTIGTGTAKDIHTVMCGLNALEKSPGKYTIVKGKNPAKKPTGEAAKTFYDLKKGRNFTVLNMEVRFKGDFTAQPQFQAFLAKDFKDLLNEKCVI